jgi:hypothetical protein
MCSGLHFFAERTVTGIAHLDMLGKFVVRILEDGGPDNTLFQQDGAPSRFYREAA